jgi:hypothetical protein
VFSDNEIMELAKSVKFSECLPIVFLDQIVRLRQFDGVAIVGRSELRS